MKKNTAQDGSYLAKLRFDTSLLTSPMALLLQSPRLIILALFAIVVAGSSAWLTLPRELNPQVEIPLVSVTTALPGADPLSVERLVTQKLEQEINALANIESIQSSSRDSFSQIIVTFSNSTDPDKALDEVRQRVDAVSDLPTQATSPRVAKLDFNDQPVLTIALSGDVDRRSLSIIAKEITDNAQDTQSIRTTSTTGEEEEEIVIAVRETTLATYGIDNQAIAAAVRSFDTTLPLGSLQINQTEYQLKVDTSAHSIADIRRIPIRVGQETVQLADVADVYLQAAPNNTQSYLSTKESTRLTAAQISFFKTRSATVDQAVSDAKTITQEVLASYPMIFVTTSADGSERIADQFDELAGNFIATIGLVFLILFLFTGARQAAIAALSIPLTFLSTFALMQVFGITLNFLSLFSLLLALGLVVDDAIVITQATYRYGKKFTPLQSGLLVFKDFFVPIWTTTLTTVWAFLPLVLATGIIGQFIRTIPIMVSATLLSSTTIAVAITLPMIVLISTLQQKTQKKQAKEIVGLDTGLIDFSPVAQRYRLYLRYIIDSAARRRWVYALSAFFLVLSGTFLPTGLLKNEFFPQTDQDQVSVTIEGPVGWPVEKTKEVLTLVEEMVLEVPEVQSVISTTNQSGNQSGNAQSGSHVAGMVVLLAQTEERERDSTAIANDLRERFATVSQAKVSVSQSNAGPPVGADLEISIVSDSLGDLEATATDFIAILQTVPEAINPQSSLQQTPGQIMIVLNPQALSQRGLQPGQVAGWLRAAITGSEAASITTNQIEQSVVIRYPEEKLNLSMLQNLVLPSALGSYSLAEIADFQLESSPVSVDRKNLQREVRVTADANGASAPELLAAFEKAAQEYQLKDGIAWSVGGANEENQESTLSIIRAMGISALLILATMVLQLNSFRQAGLVLIVIPLAIAGVFFNFTLLGIPLSFPALIGTLALFGIVVNNSILLVEKINQNIRFGLPFTTAIVDACSSRVEAIFFTSLTTAVGLLPITIADPFWRGLGGAIIAGLSFSGIFILFLLPCLYYDVYPAKRAGKKAAQ